MKTLRLLSAGALALALQTAVHSETLDISVDAGAAVPLGYAKEGLRTAPALGAQVYFPVNEWLSLGLGGGYFFNTAVKDTTLESQFGSPVDVDRDGLPDHLALETHQDFKVFYLTPGFKISGGNKRWRPYIAMAGGVYHTRASDSLQIAKGVSSNGYHYSSPSLASQVFSPESHLEFSDTGITNTVAGFNGGAGVEWRFAENGSVAAEVRYHQLIMDGIGDLQYFVPSLRLGVRF